MKTRVNAPESSPPRRRLILALEAKKQDRGVSCGDLIALRQRTPLLDILGESAYPFPEMFRKEKDEAAPFSGSKIQTDEATHLSEPKTQRESAELLQGTLDLLVLKAVSLGKMHGYGILLRIQQISGGSLVIEQGALYPALYRLERQGMLETEWGISENNRKAKYYILTNRGRVRLKDEERSWTRLVEAIGMALKARPSEV